MTDILLGILAILAGAFMCLRGQLVLRIVFPIWGFFAGFAFGAGLVAGFSDEHFLGTVLGWALGLVFALIFAVLAYAYYAVAVVLAMSAIGFALGSGLMVALGIDWNWAVVLVGVLAGAILGIGAVVSNVPMIVLILVSALGGAIAMVTGFMLLTGAVDSSTFTSESFATRVDDSWWWYVAVVVLAVGGTVSQTRDAVAMRRSMRSYWVETTP